MTSGICLATFCPPNSLFSFYYLQHHVHIWHRRAHNQPVMESRDLVLVSKLVSRPIFASLGLKGFWSRDFEYCKEMVYLLKFLQFDNFIFVEFADKKQPKIWKNSSQKWWQHYFNFSKMHKFWSLEPQSRTFKLSLSLNIVPKF